MLCYHSRRVGCSAIVYILLHIWNWLIFGICLCWSTMRTEINSRCMMSWELRVYESAYLSNQFLSYVYGIYTFWKWAVFVWDTPILPRHSYLILLRSIIVILHQAVWCTYNTRDQCSSNWVPRDPGVPRRRVRSSAKCWWKLGNFVYRHNYVS